MNSPNTIRERPWIPTKVKLVAGAVVLAVVAGVAIQCAKAVGDLSDGISDTFDATDNDDEMSADGGDEDDVTNTAADGGEKIRVRKERTDLDIAGNAFDKRLWGKMDSLMHTLRRFPILPEFEDGDGCGNANRVKPGLNIRRKSNEFGTQSLTISTGIPGCNARDLMYVLWRINEYDELVLYVKIEGFDGGSIEIPASEKDIKVINRFVNLAAEYARDLENLESTLRDFKRAGSNFDAGVFQRRTGLSCHPDEATCHLNETYRARAARERHRVQPLKFLVDDSAEYIKNQKERFEAEEQDRGDLSCVRR
jgi:hypothetical protein